MTFYGPGETPCQELPHTPCILLVFSLLEVPRSGLRMYSILIQGTGGVGGWEGVVGWRVGGGGKVGVWRVGGGGGGNG